MRRVLLVGGGGPMGPGRWDLRQADPWCREEGSLEQREGSLSPGLEVLLGSEAIPKSNTIKFSAVLLEL